MGLQLTTYGIEIGHPGLVPGHGWARRAGYNFFQPPLVPIRRQRPTHASRRCLFQISVDSTLGDQTTASNLLLFEPEGMESENFFEFTHAEPRLWQSDSSTSQ
jgi:hypothetical protein